MKIIRTRIQNKHELEATWSQTDFVPLKGEFIIYDCEVDADGNVLELPEGRDEPYTYERVKLGNGITSVNDLPFLDSSVLAEIADINAELIKKVDASVIENSVMFDKSFGNGPGTVAEGNHAHGDIELQIQSIEETINANYYDTSDSVDFFTEITPSHTVWSATSSSKVTDVDIIGGRYVCTTSVAEHGLKTNNLTDLMEVVRGKTIVAVADISSDNYTLYVKMYNGTAWSFGRVKSTDKVVTVNVPDNITQFKFGLEYTGDGSAPETCVMTNFAVYLVNDITITSTTNIPNRNYTIWSWDDEEIINPDAFATFCNAYKINRVYQHISTSTFNIEQIRKFVGTMQKNRVSVNWLTGDPSWTLADHHYHIVDQIQKVVSYNMSIQNDYEKIGTIQFDIEPYTLEEWDTDQASVIKQYQDAIVLMYNECIAKQLSLNVCVASWFDGVTYDNEYGQGNLFDFVSKHSSSTVIMAYSTTSYVSIAEDEIRMGAANGKNVAVGLETHSVTDSVTEDITFANKPIEDLYRAFETLFLVYKLYGVYKGYEFIIHDYAHFKTYVESFNLTVVSNNILDKLNTENKADLISAINEINNEVESLKGSSSSKVLWLGTSIPSGDGVDPENTYPKMVEKMLGCKVYNNSRAGSFMAYYTSDGSANWTTSAEVDSTGFVLGYSLTQTEADVDNKFRSKLNSIRSSERLPTSWVDNHLNDFKAHSYENLVLPYINGEIDTCDVVIIDHGFNDRSNIFNVSGQHPDSERDNISYWPPDQVGGATVEYPVTGGNGGWFWLTHLSDDRYYDGFVYMKTLQAIANSGDGSMRGEYFGAMTYLIEKIRQVNPRIKIIIGNYFSQDSGIDSMSSFVTKYILEGNQQIANFYGLPCVNVYKYTGLRNRTITVNGSAITDMYWFCPDGTHPHTDTTGESNKLIAEVYVHELDRYI